MQKIARLSFIAMIMVVFIVTLLGNTQCVFGESSVTVIYDANGGDVYPTSEVIFAGSSVILPSPTYGGHTFCGWHTSAGKVAGLAGASYTINGDTTLYAQWMPSWSESYMEKYAYHREYSLYYVEYELQYCVNGGRYETYFASAYFDNYAAAWAFSLTGGPIPIPYNEQVWIDSINRWWVAFEIDNYRVEIHDVGDKTTRVYYGSLFPCTYEAPPVWLSTIGEYTSPITGVQGAVVTAETYLYEDPGYFGGDEPIIIYEYWWTTTYSGWVFGEPDVYTIYIIPVNDIVYSCR